MIDLMTSRDSYEVWSKSAFGITPERLSTQVALPEIAGATEPIVVGTTEKVAGAAGPVTKPIRERIDMAVNRGARWLALQDKPNAEKRVGLLYFNNPPGKGNIGASYLNVFPTLVAVLARLRESGYQTGDRLPTEKELEALLEISGRNIEVWAPGELEALVEKGHVVLVSMKKYRSWFEALPKQFRDFVNAGWGPPEKSQLMTITSRDGEKFFVVPGVRMGNIFLGPQPLRTTFDRTMEMAHNINVPPPHSYIAAYLWYRNEFQADAVVHFGRHGTLEFLPGKNVGQAGWDSSEAILGDLPHAYYYIMDGGGESTTARRRSAAVMISHLTPMVVAAGAQDQFAALRQIFENLEKTEDVSPALEEQYRQSAATEIRRLKLDTQLGLDLGKTNWTDVRERIATFLDATEAGPIPAGMHTVGRLPDPALQKESLAELIKLGLSDAEKRQWRAQIDGWVNAIYDGRKPALPDGVIDQPKKTGFKPCWRRAKPGCAIFSNRRKESFRPSSRFLAVASNPAGCQAIRYARPLACPRAATFTPSIRISSPRAKHGNSARRWPPRCWTGSRRTRAKCRRRSAWCCGMARPSGTREPWSRKPCI